jgi:hypothetical protein
MQPLAGSRLYLTTIVQPLPIVATGSVPGSDAGPSEEVASLDSADPRKSRAWTTEQLRSLTLLYVFVAPYQRLWPEARWLSFLVRSRSRLRIVSVVLDLKSATLY